MVLRGFRDLVFLVKARKGDKRMKATEMRFSSSPVALSTSLSYRPGECLSCGDMTYGRIERLSDGAARTVRICPACGVE